jgi:hypothetical protein
MLSYGLNPWGPEDIDEAIALSKALKENGDAVDAEADWRSKPKGNTTSQSQTRKLSQDFIKELQLQIQLVSTRFV